MKVMQSFRAGRIRLHQLMSELEKGIAAWHKSSSTEELNDFLGMSWDEYALMVDDPKFFIRAMHQQLAAMLPKEHEDV